MNQSDILEHTLLFNELDRMDRNRTSSHEVGNATSSEIVYDNLISQMKILKEEILNIQKQLIDNDKNRKQLLIKLRKNEESFRSLMVQASRIDLNSSISKDSLTTVKDKEKSIAKKDDKIRELDQRIDLKKNEIDHLGQISNQLSRRRLKKREEKLKNELVRLQKKRGSIEERQRKIINSRLHKYYQSVIKKSKKFGRVHAVEEMRLERNNSLNEKIMSAQKQKEHFEDVSHDSNLFVSGIYNFRGFFSYAHQGMLNSYCKVLNTKDGVLNSFRRVDKNVINRVHLIYGNDFDSSNQHDNISNDIIGEEVKKEDSNIISNNDNIVTSQQQNYSMDEGMEITVTSDSRIEDIAQTLMLQKQYGNHCYAIFNNIKFDNMEYDSVNEIIDAYQDYLNLEQQKVRR